MGWGSSFRKPAAPTYVAPAATIEPDPVDWDRLVTLDFETYYDDDYTLKKLSTSEYVRDPRFKAQMCGIKIGNKPTRIVPAASIGMALSAIPWQTHSLLAHHAQFDGFILSHHYKVFPKKIYCSLSMARGLYSSEIGAGLHEVSIYTGGPGKIEGALDESKGVLNWPKAMVERVGKYCANDVEECLRSFKFMWPLMPRDEMDFIDVVCRMFTDPVLRVDIPRVQKELEREVAAKRALMLSVADRAAHLKLDSKQLKELGPNPSEEDILVRKAKKLIGSNAFADLLRDEGVEPPVKISKAWIDKPKHERTDEGKWAYAFSKTDLEFVKLEEHPNPRVRGLVEARLAVKSASNETRAGRFLEAGKDGMPLPAYYKYGAALTNRLGGGNKMNMQNLKRGGELRKSILAPEGYELVVVDSGQIEARVNAWLWGQDDLLDGFRAGDAFAKAHAHIPKKERPLARGDNRDPYCKFADTIYGREITTLDEMERFVGKVGILGLGYQMGAPRLQNTLALGSMGPAVHLPIDQCEKIVYAYRSRNHKIKQGWSICQRIIEEMAAGIEGSHKCISWAKNTLFLPNGMSLRYPELRDKRVAALVARKLNPDIDDGDDLDMDRPHYVYESKGAETKLYGGKLCENIVQALARIIVLKQTLNISRKHRVVMSTHDEAAALAKKAQAEKVYQFALAEFQKPLPWCTDLPLNAEGGHAHNYSK